MLRTSMFYSILFSLLYSFSTLYGQEVSLHGTVYNNSNNPVSGIIVILQEADISDTTGADGEYHLIGNTSVQKEFQQKAISRSIEISNSRINFGVHKQSEHVSFQVFDLRGRKTGDGIEKVLNKGNYSLGIGSILQDVSHSIYIIRFKIGERCFTKKIYNSGIHKGFTGLECNYSPNAPGLSKSTQSSEAKDTLVFTKQGQVITRLEVTDYVDTLSDLFIVQRIIEGEVYDSDREIGKIRALISGGNIPESSPLETQLQYFPESLQYSGFIYTVYLSQQMDHTIYIQAFDTLDHFIGRSDDVTFGNSGSTISVPAFDPTNALPSIELNDTSLSINDSVMLSPHVSDTFEGTIDNYSWKCGNGSWFAVDGGDTAVTAPSTAQTWVCSLRVIDDDSNTVYGVKIVNVETQGPTALAGNDTTVGINDTVNLIGSGSSDESEIVEYSWKCGNGSWFTVDGGDTAVTAPSTVQTLVCSLKVTDDEDNIAYDEFSLSVSYFTKDTIAPVIQLAGASYIYIALGSTWADPGATATDINIDGEEVDLTDSITVSGSVDPSALGIYTLTYYVKDDAGNSTRVVRDVQVIDPNSTDTVPPVIILIDAGDGRGDTAVVVEGERYSESGVIADDNVDGDISEWINIDRSQLETSTAGTYHIIYTVSDNAGNIADKKRTVIVEAD